MTPSPSTQNATPTTSRGITNLLLGIAGGAVIGARKRLPEESRTAATVAGLALLGAAAQAPLLDALRRAGTRRRCADVKFSFVVARPVELVFNFMRDFENFPRFISQLREVRDYGDGRSHWCATSPAGKVVEWDTITTKYVPNRVIAWESVGSSRISTSGLLRFKPETGRTCIEVNVSYQILQGDLPDALAALTTSSRAEQLAQDIREVAHFLESTSETELREIAAS